MIVNQDLVIAILGTMVLLVKGQFAPITVMAEVHAILNDCLQKKPAVIILRHGMRINKSAVYVIRVFAVLPVKNRSVLLVLILVMVWAMREAEIALAEAFAITLAVFASALVVFLAQSVNIELLVGNYNVVGNLVHRLPFITPAF